MKEEKYFLNIPQPPYYKCDTLHTHKDDSTKYDFLDILGLLDLNLIPSLSRSESSP